MGKGEERPSHDLCNKAPNMQKMYLVYQFRKLVITIQPTSEDFSSFNKKYTKYIPYIPWPTPCEVAVAMQTMVKCEHLAAESSRVVGIRLGRALP